MLNSSRICVDANCVVRLLTDPADLPIHGLWQRWRAEGRLYVASRLLLYEVTNALYRYQQQGTRLASTIREALVMALELQISLHDDLALHQQAIDMAARFSLPAAYDAHYLALAESLGIQFWTTDRRLANTVQPHLPWVHLVGE
jgi:predicted nucleic acid-binding protein